MAYSYQPSYQGNAPQPNTAQNLQFYPSSYSGVSGHTTPSQASYGNYGSPQPPAAAAYPGYGVGTAASSFGGGGIGGGAISGRMGDSSQGLRTGWLAAFGTEGYEHEPPLMEELGVNFGHIKSKVCYICPQVDVGIDFLVQDTDVGFIRRWLCSIRLQHLHRILWTTRIYMVDFCF